MTKVYTGMGINLVVTKSPTFELFNDYLDSLSKQAVKDATQRTESLNLYDRFLKGMPTLRSLEPEELLELREQGGHVMLSYRKLYRSHCITNASCALQACRSWLASYAAVLAHLRHTQADTAAPCDLPQNGTRRQL